MDPSAGKLPVAVFLVHLFNKPEVSSDSIRGHQSGSIYCPETELLSRAIVRRVKSIETNILVGFFGLTICFW